MQEQERLEAFDKIILHSHKASTQKMYHWQARKFLEVLAEKNPPPARMQQIAARYLRKLDSTKSRPYFLQACSVVRTICAEVLKKPLPDDFMRRIQSGNAHPKK